MAKKEQVLGQEEIKNPNPDSFEIVDKEVFDQFMQDMNSIPDIGQPFTGEYQAPGYALENFQKRIPGVAPDEFSSIGGLEEIRARDQGRAEKWVNAGGKALGLAGTTFLEGTVGLFMGIGAAVQDKDFESFYDNEFAQSLDAFTAWMEEELPNYWTQEEHDAGFFEKLGTANFWADSILKNMGFMAGAYATGMAASAAISPALRLKELSRMSKVLKEAQTAGKSFKGIEGAALMDEIATISPKLAKRGALNALTSSAVAAKAESGIEAREAGRLIDSSRDSIIDELVASYREQNTFGTDDEAVLVAQAEQEFDAMRTGAMNTVFAENMAVLTAGNLVQFGKQFGRGYVADRRTLNPILQGAKGELKQFNPFIIKAANVLYRPLWEMTEEQLQGVSREAMGDFVNKKAANAGKHDLGMFLESHMEGMRKTYGSQQGWEEGFAGFVMGALGIPGFSRSTTGGVGGIKMQGGVWDSFKDNKRKTQATQRIVDQLNTFNNNDVFKSYSDNLIRNMNYEHDKLEFLENGDIFNYKNAEHGQLISDVIAHINAGQFEDFLAKAESLKNSSAAELREMFSMTDPDTQAKTDPYQDLTDEELEARAAETGDNMLEHAKSIRDTKQLVESRFPNLKNTYGETGAEEIIQTLIYYGSTINNVDGRIEELEDMIGEGLQETLMSGNKVEINDKIKELEQKHPQLPVRELAEDLSKLYDRRETFVEAYQEALQGKSIEQIARDVIEKHQAAEDEANIEGAEDKKSARWAKEQRDKGNFFRVKAAHKPPARGKNPIPYTVKIGDQSIQVDDLEFFYDKENTRKVRVREGNEYEVYDADTLDNSFQLYTQYIGEKIFADKELSKQEKKTYSENKDSIDNYVKERERLTQELSSEVAEQEATGEEELYLRVKDLESFEVVDSVTGKSTGTTIPIVDVIDQINADNTYSTQEFKGVVNRHRRVTALERMLERRRELLDQMDSEINSRIARLEEISQDLNSLQNNRTKNNLYRDPKTNRVIKKTVALDMLASLEAERAKIKSWIANLQGEKQVLQEERQAIKDDINNLSTDFHRPLKEKATDDLAQIEEEIKAAEEDLDIANGILTRVESAIADLKSKILQSLGAIKNVLGTKAYNSFFLNTLEDFVDNDLYDMFSNPRMQSFIDNFGSTVAMVENYAQTAPQSDIAVFNEAVKGLEDALNQIAEDSGNLKGVLDVFKNFEKLQGLLTELNIKKELLNEQIYIIRNEIAKETKSDLLTDQLDLKSEEEIVAEAEAINSPKVDITNAFMTTTGPSINKETGRYDDEAANRWFTATNEIKQNPITEGEYTLKPVTPESNPELFTEIERDIIHKDSLKEGGAGIIKVQLYRNGQPYTINEQPVYSTLRDVKLSQVGAKGTGISYTNKYELTQQEISEGIARYNAFKQSLRDAINEGKDVNLAVDAITRGVPVTEKDAEGNRATHDVKGRVISQEQSYDDVNLVINTKRYIVTSANEIIEGVPGFPYFEKKGNIVQGNVRKLNNQEADTLYNLLLLYARNKTKFPLFSKNKNRNEANRKKINQIYDSEGEVVPVGIFGYLARMVYFGTFKSNGRQKRGHIYLDGSDLVFGQDRAKFTEEGLLEKKEELMAFFESKNHQLRNNILNRNEPYVEIVSMDASSGLANTRTWGSYKEYLMSSDRESASPVSTDLVTEDKMQFAASNVIYDTEDFIPVSDERREIVDEARAKINEAALKKGESQSPKKEVDDILASVNKLQKDYVTTKKTNKSEEGVEESAEAQLASAIGDAVGKLFAQQRSAQEGTKEAGPGTAVSKLGGKSASAEKAQNKPVQASKQEPTDEEGGPMAAISKLKSKGGQDVSGTAKATPPSKDPTGAQSEIEALLGKDAAPKAKPKGTRPPLNFRKKSLQKTTNKEIIEEVRAWVAKVAPAVDFVPTKKIIDGKAMGMFRDRAIYVWENAEQGTAFHEALHAIMNMYLTPAEIKALHRSFRKSKEYASRMEDIKVHYPELSGELLEQEALAEMFRDFMYNDGKMNLPPVQKNVFQKMWDFIKFIVFGDPSFVEEVFHNIAAGTYAERKTPLNLSNPGHSYYSKRVGDLSPETTKDIYDHMTVMFTNFLVKRVGSIGALFERDAVKASDVRAIYREILDDMLAIASTEEVAALITEKNLWPQLVNQHRQHLNEIGILIKVDEAQLEELLEGEDLVEEGAKGRDSLGFVESIRFNTKDGMPNIIKFMFSTIYQVQENEKGGYDAKLNSIGGFIPKDFGTIYNKVAHNLTYLDNFEDMIEQLKALAITDPELLSIIKLLKPDKADLTDTEFRVQQLFTQQFAKAMMEYDLLYFNEEGDFYNIDSNSATTGRVVKNKWKSLFFAEAASGENEMFTLKGNQVEVNKTKLAKLAKDVTSKKGVPGTRALLDFLSAFGITFTNPHKAVTKKGFKEAAMSVFGTVVKEFGPLTDDAFLIYASRAELVGAFNVLSNIEADTSNMAVELQHQNPDGNTVYGVTLYNYLTRIRTLLLSGRGLEFYENNSGSANSILLRRAREGNIFKVKIAEGIKSKFRAIQPKKTDGASTADKIAMSFNNTLLGKYHLLRPGDKSLEYVIETEEFVKDSEMNMDNISEIVNNYLVDELLRIVDYHTTNGLKNISGFSEAGARLSIFQDIITNRKIVSELEAVRSEEDIVRVLGKHSAELRDAYNDYFSNKVRAYTKMLTENKVLQYSQGADSYINMGISDAVLDQIGAENRTVLTQEEVTRLVKRFTVNYFISGVEQTKILFGDQAFYTDFFKRTSGAIGTKKLSLVGPRIDHHLNRDNKRLDKKKADGTFKVVTRADVKVHSRYYDEYKQVFKDYAMNTLKMSETNANEYAEEIAAPYADINEADGQGYITLDEYREFLSRTGDWTDRHEAIFEKAQQGEKLNSSEMFYFQPLKPQYFGPRANSDTFIPSFLKFSLMPLIPSMVEKAQMKKVLNAMTKDQVGILVFESAFKVGAPLEEDGTLAPFYNKNGTPNTKFDTIIDLDYRFMGIQVDIAPKVKTEGPVGTQSRKLITNNLMENGELKPITVFKDGKATTSTENTRDLLDRYNEAWDSIFNIEYNNVISKFGLKRTAEGFAVEDADMLIDSLKDSAQKRSYSSNVTEAFSSILDENGELAYTFDILPNSDKVEQLMLAIVRDRMLKMKVPGGMKVQGASTGFEFSKRQLSVDEKWGSNELKFYTQGEGGRVSKMQIKLPYYFKDIYDISGNYDQIPQELRNIIGFRIPTDGLHSIENIEVVGFLPKSAGDLILVPSEIVAKAGSDFDIDKLTVYFPELVRNSKTDKLVRAGELSYQEYLNSSYYYITQKAADRLESGTEQDISELVTEVKNIASTGITENTMGDLYNKYKDVYGEELTFNLIEDLRIYINNSIEALDSSTDYEKKVAFNEVLDVMNTVLEAPEMFHQLIDPITIDPVDKIAMYIEFVKQGHRGDIDGKAFKKWYQKNKGRNFKTPTQNLEWQTAVEVWEDYQGGKATIGLAANHVVHHPLSQLANLRYKDTITNYLGEVSTHLNFKTPRGYDTNSLANNVNFSGEYISSVMSTIANAYLDVANNPAIFKINGQIDVAHIIFMLVRRGVPLDSVGLFLKQPVIENYLNGSRTNNSTIVQSKIQLDLSKKKGDRAGYEKMLTELESVQDLSDLFDNTEIKYDKKDLANIIQKVENGEELTNTELAIQEQTLSDFVRYRMIASKLKDLMNASKQDTILLKNLSDLEVQKRAIDAVVADGSFENTDKLYSDTFLSVLKEMQDNLISMFSPYFLVHQPQADQVLKPIKDRIFDAQKDANNASRSINLVNREFVSFLLHTVETRWRGESWALHEFQTLLMDASGNNITTAQQLAGFRNNENYGLSENLIIKRLLPVFDRREGDYSNLHNIQDNSMRVSAIEENEITDSFRDLYNSVPTFADNLIKVSLLQSGIANSPTSYRQFIPFESFVKLVKPIFDKYKNNSLSEVDLLDFEDQLYRNSMNNNYFVPFEAGYFYNPKTKRMAPKLSENVATGVSTLKTIGVIETPYIKTRVGKREYLLKNTGRIEEDKKGRVYTIFETAFPLGDGMFAKQYYPSLEGAIENSIAETVLWSEAKNSQGNYKALSPTDANVEVAQEVTQDNLSEAAKRAKRLSEELNKKCE